MPKLLAKFAAAPTRDNALRVVRYANQHRFALLLLSPEDRAILYNVFNLLTEAK